MKDLPILFSGAMVRAILEDRKTQTRRMITPANSLFNGSAWSKWARESEVDKHFDWLAAMKDDGPSPAGNPGPYLHLPYVGPDPDWQGTRHRIYPRRQPGHRLWVRESLSISDGIISYSADNEDCALASESERAAQLWNRYVREKDGRVYGGIPSIFMPRWASRSTLEITGVRVERLQEISVEDARAEGVFTPEAAYAQNGPKAPVYGYAGLWEDINGVGSWALNPWVWVIEFKRVTT